MATEDRWHDFAKEKPSDDMEGRNFIVSNGHYEKIATWCGYWENEPFIGDRLCDEVVRWKGYLTPEEEKANEATCKELKEVKFHEMNAIKLGLRNDKLYLKPDADKVIARHKYKRCLDNAWWCRKSNKAYAWSASNLRGWKIAVYYDKKAELYRMWCKIWLKLAEKFKEPK